MVNAKAGTIMDNAYSYDAVSNVLGIKNNAPPTEWQGRRTDEPQLYFMTHYIVWQAQRVLIKGTDNKSASYTLSMG